MPKKKCHVDLSTEERATLEHGHSASLSKFLEAMHAAVP
jgi:hypothetical protein